VLLAPAMNVRMWKHPAVQSNVSALKNRGHLFVDPEPGTLACGMEGEGRLADVDAIVAAILHVLHRDQSLAGHKVLITAGPTLEDLDPIRFLSNRSSGKMGYAAAAAARDRGADVVLVSGPTSNDPPAGVKTISVRSAAEMKAAVLALYPQMDFVLKAAAVADYRPAEYAAEKVKKSGPPAAITLVATDDILAELGAAKKNQILVGFAAETQDILAHAREKMARKNLDMIVANDATSGVFGSDSATVHILSSSGETVTVANRSKLEIAHRILDLALDAHQRRRSGTASH
jgi:phosphopantothenoylcysteine decarboxylase/phosphopantothenate--cysteine ligase